jgi:hypothetical protein
MRQYRKHYDKRTDEPVCDICTADAEKEDTRDKREQESKSVNELLASMKCYGAE